jgi:hypothetical protein
MVLGVIITSIQSTVALRKALNIVTDRRTSDDRLTYSQF